VTKWAGGKSYDDLTFLEHQLDATHHKVFRLKRKVQITCGTGGVGLMEFEATDIISYPSTIDVILTTFKCGQGL
jgi:hypothetical protein